MALIYVCFRSERFYSEKNAGFAQGQRFHRSVPIHSVKLMKTSVGIYDRVTYDMG